MNYDLNFISLTTASIDKTHGLPGVGWWGLSISQELLAAGLQEITNDNAAKEFYLTDLVKIISAKGIKIIPIRANDSIKEAPTIPTAIH